MSDAVQVRAFSEADRAWVSQYRLSVGRHYSEHFAMAPDEFRQADQVVGRFDSACDSVLTHGWAKWPSVETSHNELSVALAVLQSPGYRVTTLEYEPRLDHSDKTVDFVALGEDGKRWIVDVKTIAPAHIDRWEQFERARKEEWLTPGTDIVIFQEWMGGEIWHSFMSARSRMLEYTLEVEGKLALCYPDFDPLRTLLMFCGNGFHWHEDQLEDFVEFYVSGVYRFDDPMAAMEQHDSKKKEVVLPRRLKRFGYLERKSRDIAASRVCWHVTPPRFPSSMRAGEGAV